MDELMDIPYCGIKSRPISKALFLPTIQVKIFIYFGPLVKAEFPSKM